MKSSNVIFRFFLSAFFAMLIAFMPEQSVSAAPVVKTDGIQTSFGESKVIIKIIIIIKRRKAGIAEIENIRLAGDSKSLVNNEVLADAYVEGGKLFILPLKGEGVQGQLLVPAGFKVNNAVGLKLGEKGGFGLKAGKMDFGPNKMGNFEIQD
ncbi:MAG: hypothetical protein R3C61_24015 [Bacteroidia bacterium]